MSLQITVVEAQNLPRTNQGGRGKINPFFKISFANQVYQTKAFANDLNPKFNESFTFNDSPKKDNLVFELFDNDPTGIVKLISTYVVSSDALPTGRATIPLNQANGAAAGQLVTEIVHIQPAPPQVAVRPPPTVIVTTPPPTVVVTAPTKTTKSLQITIIQGRGLPLVSSAGGGRKGGGKGTSAIDPFFKVTLGNQLYQTKIFQNEQNPRYNETFVFEDTPKRDKVNFELYNNDGGAGQLIASVSFDTDKVPTGKATLNLQTPQGVACGSLDIEIAHLETIGGGGGGGGGRGGPSKSTNVVVSSPPPTVVVTAPTKTTKSLQITIIQGRSLPLLSSTGGGRKGGGKGTDVIDPFFKVTLGKQLYQTKIFQNEQNPRYNETFVFEDTPKRDKVNFELYNNDGGAGQLVASVSFDTDKVPTGKATLNLQTPQGVACGYLDIEIAHLETTSNVTQPQVVVVGGGAPQGVSTRGNVVVAAPVQTVVVSSGGRRK